MSILTLFSLFVSFGLVGPVSREMHGKTLEECLAVTARAVCPITGYAGSVNACFRQVGQYGYDNGAHEELVRRRLEILDTIFISCPRLASFPLESGIDEYRLKTHESEIVKARLRSSRYQIQKMVEQYTADTVKMCLLSLEPAPLQMQEMVERYTADTVKMCLLSPESEDLLRVLPLEALSRLRASISKTMFRASISELIFHASISELINSQTLLHMGISGEAIVDRICLECPSADYKFTDEEVKSALRRLSKQIINNSKEIQKSHDQVLISSIDSPLAILNEAAGLRRHKILMPHTTIVWRFIVTLDDTPLSFEETKELRDDLRRVWNQLVPRSLCDYQTASSILNTTCRRPLRSSLPPQASLAITQFLLAEEVYGIYSLVNKTRAETTETNIKARIKKLVPLSYSFPEEGDEEVGIYLPNGSFGRGENPKGMRAIFEAIFEAEVQRMLYKLL